MFHRISAKITDELIRLNTISSVDRDTYEYGVQHILITLLNIITVIIIGFVLNAVIEALVFITAFIPLRIFAGGFHFSTPIRCYIFSSGFVAAVLLAMRYFSISLLIYCLLYCLASAIILIFSPVEDVNKPLDQVEKKVYRKRAIIVLGTECGLTMILYFFEQFILVQSMMVSNIVLALMVVLGVIKNIFVNSK